MESARDLLAEAARSGRRLREAIPDVYDAYKAQHSAALDGDGQLPPRIRELIALAIAVTKQCDGCIAAHARGAAQRGASREEVAEMLGVAILMNGGPATVWGPRAFAAFEEFGDGSD